MYRTKSYLLIAPTILLMIFGVFSFQPLKAQDADEMATLRVVGEASLSGGDIIADRDDNRDSNGNLTAGLRIVSDLTGFTFDSNNGILKTQQQPGANLLYLSTNERIVRIYKDGFPPFTLVLSDQGIDLEAGKVWEVRITGNQRSTNVPVQFNIDPEDATLFIDGEEFQVDGTVFDADLSTGDHFIQIRKPRFELVDDTISVSADRVNSFNYSLSEINPIRVQITSTPSGASIYLDDSPGSSGTTPHFVNIYPGPLKIELRLEGYSTVVEELEYNESIGDLNYNLSKFEGYLSVNTTPENAVVLVDGQRYTNKQGIPLTPGVKNLEVRAEGFDPQTQTVDIVQQDTLAVDVNLNQITGNIFFTIQQQEANVTMTREGQVVEEWQGFKNFRNLPVGTYQITAELNNFQTEMRTIELRRNAEESVDFDLVQIDGQGAFTLNSVFDDAKVTIQGPRFRRSYTDLPISEPSIPFGQYEVTIEKKGFKDVEKQIEINSLSQDITIVDEFEPKTKGKALFRSLFIPGTGHGYLDKGGRGFLYFLGSAAAIGWTVKSYLEYSDSYQSYTDALRTYNEAPAGRNFSSLRDDYEEAHQVAMDAREYVNYGLIALAGIKGLETLDLLFQRSNKKKLRNAKLEFNAGNNGLSMKVNF